MVNGTCEVRIGEPCIWNNIHSKVQNDAWPKSLREPVSSELFGSSSWLNFLTGDDRAGRLPTTLKGERVFGQARDSLALAAATKGFLISTELRTPRLDSETQMQRRIQDALALKEAADVVCVTSHPGSVPPMLFCKYLHRATGMETIVPLVGRDCQPAEFGTSLADRFHEAGSAAVLCLSGDYAGVGPFPMDSSQILLALRRIDWLGPRPVFGAAIHLQAQPRGPALARATQKALAGAEIFFSQLLLDSDRVVDFINEMRSRRELTKIPLVLGIPLIGSQRGFETLENLPGIDRSSPFLQQFRSTHDVHTLGLHCGNQLVEFALSLRSKGVMGIHVMPFGISAAETAAWIRKLRIQNEMPAANLEQGSLR
jgi:5,10-methylenetetrahydrofolate reductase